MKYIITTALVIIFMFPLNVSAQYKFEEVIEVPHSKVKDQCNTGTCWSFSTVSFLEAEATRLSKKEVNLSKMYIVRNIYKDKGMNYLLRQGKANFSEGGLAHDVINILKKDGVVPQGKTSIQDPAYHDHSELISILTGMLDKLIKDQTVGKKWKQAYDAILDIYFGIIPKKFQYESKDYNPQSFANEMGLDADNYINLTSFTHHPFHSEFVLEIPDNYSNGSFINLPMDDLEKVVDNALKNGYSLAWDGDVSESFFSQNQGLAVLPASKDDNGFLAPCKEMKYSVDKRQALFENYTTTDDHLMHLVGIAKDQKGNIYYKIKNSWGEDGVYKGYLYMSKAYFKYKTVSITLHKNAIPKELPLLK
jgi:bleomycin hydrolase